MKYIVKSGGRPSKNIPLNLIIGAIAVLVMGSVITANSATVLIASGMLVLVLRLRQHHI